MISFAQSRRRAMFSGAFLLGCGALLGGHAQAATFVVTNLNDDGTNSLRQAIIGSNASSGADTVNISATGTLNLKTALPTLSDVTLNGPGATKFIVRRNSTELFRIFTVPVGVKVTLLNLTVSNGNASGFGGGVNNTGTLAVTNCNFTGNTAGQNGGGLSNYHGKVSLNNCIFANNKAAGSGGAIVSDNRDLEGAPVGPTSLSLSNSTLSGNSATLNGGGVANLAGTLTVERTTLDGNKATQLGGGVYTTEGTVSVAASTLSNNQADEGGGFYSRSGTTLQNCTLSGNSATRRGGGFSNTDRLTAFDSCTISGNKAPAEQGSGGASVGDDRGTTTRLTSTILAGNLAPDGSAGTDFDYSGNKNSFESGGYNLLGVGNASFKTGSDADGYTASTIKLGALANNGGPTKTRALLPGSYAVNHGNTALTTDQRGTARPQGGFDDIGAFEYVGLRTSLVVTTAADEDDNTSDPAFGAGTSLREAINVANSNGDASTITFKLSGSGVQTISLRSALPVLSTPITITGPGANLLNLRPLSDDDMRLFTLSTTGAVNISGLTLRDVNSVRLGGAIYSEVSQLKVTNCVFRSNYAASGPAIATNSSGGSVVVTGCTFDDNHSTVGNGGAIFNNSNSFAITGSTFVNNVSADSGGAIYNSGVLNITGSTFAGNTTPNLGGAIGNQNRLTLTSSTLRGNKSSKVGGGIYNSGTLTIQTSTLNGNTTATDGGAIINTRQTATAPSATLTNSTLSGNNASRGGGFYSTHGTTRITNCTITANSANQGAGIFLNTDDGAPTEVGNSIVAGNSSIDVDYQIENLNDFVSKGYNLIGNGNSASKFVATGDRRGLTASDLKIGALANNGGLTQTHALLAGSPALNKGNTSLTTDQRGTARPQGSADDIGAYEAAGTLNSAPSLVKMVGPNGSTATVSGDPPVVSPLLNGQSSANTFVNFTTVVRDVDGNADLSKITFLLGSGATQLTLTYNATSNLLNAASSSGSSSSFAPGSANILTVSTGALDCANTKVTRSGTDLTIVWRLKVTTTTTLKQGLRLRAQDKSGALSALLSFGAWTFVPPAKIVAPSSSGASS